MNLMDVAAVNTFKKTSGLDPGPNLHVGEQGRLKESEMRKISAIYIEVYARLVNRADALEDGTILRLSLYL